MSEHACPTVPMRTFKKASNVLDVRDDWPREQFFRVYDRLLAASPYASSEAVADAAGFSSGNFSKWRSGKSKPTPEVLRVLANTLGVEGFVLWEAAGILPPGAAAKLAEAVRGAPVGVAQLVFPDATYPEVDRLPGLIDQLGPEDQEKIRGQLAMLIEWAEIAISKRKT